MALNETKLCQGKDVFERMNFLYQASRLVSKSSNVAASHYGNLMINCAKKAVLRMEPEIKRTVCKRCQSPLIAGETARVRLVSKPEKAVKWTCLRCRTMRRIPTKKDRHKLWIDEPESVVEVFDYTPRMKVVAPKSVVQLVTKGNGKVLTAQQTKNKCPKVHFIKDSGVASQPAELDNKAVKKQEVSIIPVEMEDNR